MRTHSSWIVAVLPAAVLLASAARADAPKGWDVEHEQPRLGEAPTVITYGPSQDPEYDAGPVAPTFWRDELVAGGGAGEPRDPATLESEANERVERLFSEP